MSFDIDEAIRWLRDASGTGLAASGLRVEQRIDSVDDPMLIGLDGLPVDTFLEDYPYARRMRRKKYNLHKRSLQIELLKAQEWIKKQNLRLMVIFEGRDAAGKGGTIKRFVEHLNPRGTRVVALTAPTARERSQWYFQRYIQQLPSGGEIVLFDRSWYNRAVVEPVMGFCTPEEHQQFMADVVPLEKMLTDSGMVLIKFWFAVSRREQIARFLLRRLDPIRQWKLSPNDLESLDRWEAYTEARDRLFERTHTDNAPWTVVRFNDKMRGRTQAMRHVLHLLDYPDKDHGILHINPELVGPPEILSRPVTRIAAAGESSSPPG